MGGVAGGGWVGGGSWTMATTTSGVAAAASRGQGRMAIDGGELRAWRGHTFPRHITYASHMLLWLPCLCLSL